MSEIYRFKVSIHNDSGIKNSKDIMKKLIETSKIIFMNYNSIKRIDNVKRLSFATILYVTDNKIERFNQSFREDVELINISNNKLEKIPNSLKKTNIKRLIITNNNIKKINIKGFNIRDLCVAKNRILKITPNKNLVDLNISDNKIKNI